VTYEVSLVGLVSISLFAVAGPYGGFVGRRVVSPGIRGEHKSTWERSFKMDLVSLAEDSPESASGEAISVEVTRGEPGQGRSGRAAPVGRQRGLTLQDGLALGLLLLYVAVFATLTVRQHDAFNTNALDLAKFDQSIWNTAQGRPFQITIGESLVIESHFSPALALFAPLYWLWADIRVLFLAQSLLLGGAGFLIYWHFRRSAPWMGLVVFTAYLMHPALHQVNLVEFRRITLAAFAISFALYHLLRRQYRWMAVGLAAALLSKEDLSVIVAMFGLYILVVQKNRRAGLITVGIGAAWFVLVPFYLLPALMTFDQTAGYQHAANRYGYLGSTLPEIATTLLSRPQVLWEFAGQPQRLRAVFDFVWPTAFLVLLAPEIALLGVPTLALLLASTSNTIGRLGAWYPTVLIVLLYWAVGLGLQRVPRGWQKPAALLLLALSAAAWFSGSELWPGPRFDARQYAVSEHDRAVAEALQEIPPGAIVMAQDPLVPHVSQRQEIYLLPWVRGGKRPEYVLFDREMRTYPVVEEAYRTLFYDYLAGTTYEVLQQVDSFYLFHYVGEERPQQELEVTWPAGMRLRGTALAAAVPGEPFGPLQETLAAGTTLRVALYWDVLEEMEQNYAVFVHALDGNGRLLGQHDGWPADAHRPTAVLQAGEHFRDVHYLTLTAPLPSAELTLRLGLYETESGAALRDSEGGEAVEIRVGKG